MFTASSMCIVFVNQPFLYDIHPVAMSNSNVSDAWIDLSPDDICRRLRDLGLVLCEADGVLVCIHCKYSLQPSGQTVSKHLWEKHSLPAKDRAGLNAFVRGLDLQDPNALPPCADGSAAHPHLAVHRGVTCLQCRYRTTSPNLLRRHMAKEHGQRKCRDGSDKGTLWAEAGLQSWSQQGKRDFWIVETRPEDGRSVVAQSPRRKRRLSQIRKEEVERVARRQQSMDAGEREDSLLSSNWMRRTGWTELFSGTDRSILVALSRPPVARAEDLNVGGVHGEEIVFSAANECRLAVVGATVDRFLDRCEDTLRHTDHSIRCCLRSHYPGRSYKSPFELPSRKSTQTRYRSLWKRMVYFCVRIHLLRENVRKDILHLPLSADLQLSTEKLWYQFVESSDISSDSRGISPTKQSSFPSPVMRPSATRRKSAKAFVPMPATVDPRSSAASSLGEAIEIISDSDCVNDSNEEGDLDEEDGPDEVDDSDEDDPDEEYLPLSTSASEDEADEDDATTLASTSADEDVDWSRSTLRTALCGSPGQRVEALTTQKGHEDSLLAAVARFCVSLCSEPYRDGKSASTVMVYFAGVLGISQDGTTFERPSNYTPKLSALVHVARLCLLEATLPRFSYPRLGWNARPCLGQQKALNKVREAFLCQGSAAPVGELLSLRAYGRTVSRTDGPTFRVEWSDDGSSVRWDGGELTMADFRGIGHQAANVVHQSIEGVLGTQAPNLDLTSLRDRMSEHKNGYSFVHDKNNGLVHGYLELSERVCADPVHNLMTRNGWNERSVRRFLKKEEQLLEQIMAMMYLRGGQAPRITEFFSILCWNGASSSRGLYVHEGSMLYITRHSKARKTTNQEFQVARYLPPEDSVSLATYLIYIRPLADMIHRTCFGTNRDRKFLFSSVETPNKSWKPSRLTAVLRKLTKQTAGVELGVQIYRQLSIAITERHLAHISKPFNRFDDKTAEADLDVALAWQSGHRPMQRGTSYGIDAAYPDSLQPALLRVYRWTSSIWHKFLGQGVSKAGGGENTPSTRSNICHIERPRKRRRTNRETSHPQTLTETATDPRPGSMDVDLAPTAASETTRQTSPLDAQPPTGTGVCGISESLLGESATVLTPVLSTPARPQNSGRAPDGNILPLTPATQKPTDRNGRASVRQLFDSTYTTFAADQVTRTPIPPTDVDVFRQFQYLEDFKLLVCKSHGHAVHNVRRHLEEQHPETKDANKAAAARLAGLNIHDPKSVNLPAAPIPPLEGLSPPVSGFRCGGTDGQCDFLSISSQKVSRHWKSAHSQGLRSQRLMYRKEVELQSFTHSRNQARWFVVTSNGAL